MNPFDFSRNTPSSSTASHNGSIRAQTSQKQKTHNFCFLGGTGNGKSSTINSLVGSEQARVGEGFCSETKKVQKYMGQDGSLYFDMPGFGDTNMKPEEITQILEEFVEKMWVEASKRNDPDFFRIDAFILVIKCSPRMASLHQDLDALKLIFGPIALQSTVLLLIHSNDGHPDKLPSNEKIIEELQKVGHLMEAMGSAGRGLDPYEWFLNWSNVDKGVFPNQRRELLELLKKPHMKPYTHRSWQIAREEISKIIAERDRENEEKFKKMLQDAMAAKDDLMAQKLQKQYEKEKKKLETLKNGNEKARQEDQKKQARVIDEIEKRHKIEMQQLQQKEKEKQEQNALEFQRRQQAEIQRIRQEENQRQARLLEEERRKSEAERQKMIKEQQEREREGERQTQLLIKEEERKKEAKRQKKMMEEQEKEKERERQQALEKNQKSVQGTTEFDFIAPCPVAGCSNSRGNAIRWHHANCGGSTKVSTTGYIRCVKCSQSGIILDWLFKCQNHDYSNLSFQGLVYALGVMCQLQNINDNILEVIVDSIQKQKKDRNYRF